MIRVMFNIILISNYIAKFLFWQEFKDVCFKI